MNNVNCIDFGCTLYVQDSCPHKEEILNPYTTTRCLDICNYYDKCSYCVNWGRHCPEPKDVEQIISFRGDNYGD